MEERHHSPLASRPAFLIKDNGTLRRFDYGTAEASIGAKNRFAMGAFYTQLSLVARGTGAFGVRF